WSKPFGRRRSLVGAEVPCNCAGSNLRSAALRGGSARPEPAEPAAPEFWIRDAGPISRVNQSQFEQLQAGTNGTAVSANQRSPAPDSRSAHGDRSTLCPYVRR